MRFFVALLLIIFLLPAHAFAGELKLIVDGSSMPSGSKAVARGPHVFVPLKPVADKIKAKMFFDQKTARVKIMRKNLTVIFYVGSGRIMINGQQRIMPITSQMNADRVFVPLGFFSDVLGCSTNYNPRSRVAFIRSSPVEAPEDILDSKDSGIKDDIKDIDDF